MSWTPTFLVRKKDIKDCDIDEKLVEKVYGKVNKEYYNNKKSSQEKIKGLEKKGIELEKEYKQEENKINKELANLNLNKNVHLSDYLKECQDRLEKISDKQIRVRKKIEAMEEAISKRIDYFRFDFLHEIQGWANDPPIRIEGKEYFDAPTEYSEHAYFLEAFLKETQIPYAIIGG